MSLVNDMLRDLDARKRKSVAITAPVRNRESKQRWWIACILLLALCIFIVIGMYFNRIVLFLGGNPAEIESAEVQPTASKLPVPELKSEPSIKQINQIKAIKWTQLSDSRGLLTFRLDKIEPFLIYRKNSEQLDIGLQKTQVATDLPADALPILSSIVLQASDTGSDSVARFVLRAPQKVEFEPQLKRSPPRLVIQVTKQAEPANKQAPIKNTEVSSAELASREPSAQKEPSVNKEPSAKRVPVANVESSTRSKPTLKAPEAELKDSLANEPENAAVGEWKKTLNAPMSDSSMVRNARRKLAKGHTEQAMDDLSLFVARSKKAYQSKYLLTQLYMAKGDYLAVKRQFASAPNNLSWALLKARAALQQGDSASALADLKNFKNGESRSDYLELLAVAQQQNGRHQAAVQNYLKLLALDSQQARWWMNMAISLEHLGHSKKAVDAYQSVLAIPDTETSQLNYVQQRLAQLSSTRHSSNSSALNPNNQ